MARKPQLDGLRWFLFVLVFVVHHYPDKFDYFGYALPVFFVLSGFLITRVLLASEQLGTRDGLKHFYIRRSLRIFPAYYAVVIVLWLAGSLSFPFYTLTYLLNIKLFALSVGPDASAFFDWFTHHWRSESLQLWSLSVEEQYYLLYPILLFTTLVRYRIKMLVAIIVFSIISRVWFLSYYPNSFYGVLITPWEYFGWGGLFALLERESKLEFLKADWTLYVSSIVICVLISIEFGLSMQGWYQFRTTHFQTPIAVALGFFIWSLWSVPDSNWTARILSWSPFVFLGEMSYALYLWHLFSWDVYYYFEAYIGFLGLFYGTLAITIMFGLASRYLVEKPANGLKRYFPYEPVKSRETTLVKSPQ